jgi:hypothetical protein
VPAELVLLKAVHFTNARNLVISKKKNFHGSFVECILVTRLDPRRLGLSVQQEKNQG